MLYLALGNIALVFAALTSRDSEIGEIFIARDSLSRSLSSRLILSFMGCFGGCLNHGFSLIKRITRITGSLSGLAMGSLSPSLSVQLIAPYPVA